MASTRHANEERFEDFFSEAKYIVLKNYLYNYLVRKRLITAAIGDRPEAYVLEVGSGLSPMITNRDRIVYSELSHRALCTLREQHGRGAYVVADCTKLPFKEGAFTHTVCSEVLEHVENDEVAIGEIARVTDREGFACITVPHRMLYFAADDRFVNHFRRYEISELEGKLERAGLRAGVIKKVLGPFEKITMFSTVMTFSLIERLFGSVGGSGKLALAIAPLFKWVNRGLAIIARVDAKVMPRALATVIYVRAEHQE